MGDATLLPCPLCGNTAVEPRRFDGEWSLVCADNRHMCEVTGMDRSDVIAAWNNRPAPALTPAQQAAEEMAEALHYLILQGEHSRSLSGSGDCGDHCSNSCPWCAVRAALAKAGKP